MLCSPFRNIHLNFFNIVYPMTIRESVNFLLSIINIIVINFLHISLHSFLVISSGKPPRSGIWGQRSCPAGSCISRGQELKPDPSQGSWHLRTLSKWDEWRKRKRKLRGRDTSGERTSREDRQASGQMQSTLRKEQ